MGMINIDNFVKSKQIKLIYKIINSEMVSWNAISVNTGYRNTIIHYGVVFFLCKCPDIKGLDIAYIPKYYLAAIEACNIFWGSCSSESKT